MLAEGLSCANAHRRRASACRTPRRDGYRQRLVAQTRGATHALGYPAFALYSDRAGACAHIADTSTARSATIRYRAARAPKHHRHGEIGSGGGGCAARPLALCRSTRLRRYKTCFGAGLQGRTDERGQAQRKRMVCRPGQLMFILWLGFGGLWCRTGLAAVARGARTDGMTGALRF